MPELLSPGVFIEEVPSPVTTVTGVSTSTLGVAGYAPRGPADQAEFVTSFAQYTRVFGPIVRESLLGMSVAAFFANGGRRAYVVRVPPADAVLADARILNEYDDESLEVGDGVVDTFFKFSATTTISADGGLAPIKPGTLSIKYRELGAPVLAQTARDRANGANLTTLTGQANYEGRVNPASLPAADFNLDALVRGTVTITYSAATVLQSVVIPVGTGSVVTGVLTVGPDTATVTFDHETGRFSLKTTGALIPVIGDNAVAITADFTPATATRTVTDAQIGTTDEGNLTGATIDGAYVTVVTSGSESINPNTVVYSTGAYNFKVTVAPHNFAKVLVDYTVAAWDLNPISVGAWANDLMIRVQGSSDSFDPDTGSYTLYDILVLLLNQDTQLFEVMEQYTDVSFTDPNNSAYFPDVMNELSDLYRVAEPASDQGVNQLSGRPRQTILAGGDELAASKTITATLPGLPVSPRSVVITYTDSTAVARTITDDGNGNLVGDVDPTGNNTLDYTTGALDLKTLFLIRGATLVNITFSSAAQEAAHDERFGDTAKQFTLGATDFYEVGEEGTFDSTNWGRSQFTSPVLIPTNRGIYALSRIEDILQVILPDFAGDVTVTGDLLDYASARSQQPSGGDRFIILTVPMGSDPQEAVDWLRFSLARSSDYAAVYWPWVRVADTLANNRPMTMPPLGHIAGIYARTDSTKNVGKTPAGTVDGQLNFLLGLEYVATQGERDLVYPSKINPLISSPQTGLAVWGGRTISNRPEWRYINARRLFMFLEKSIYNETFWAVFENNGPGLWAKLRTQIGGFLNFLFSEGYFAGANPTQAFFVVCDDTNNLAVTIDQGQVIMDVGVAPNKPAEFVRVRFAQKAIES
jgi:phage tail sheath protein FI